MDLAKCRECGSRDTQWAMHGGCTDYYCDCHTLLIEAVAEIERLEAQRQDLLSACKAVLSSPRYGDTPSEIAVQLVRAAIAKAEGKEPNP